MMKNILFITLILVTLFACKEDEHPYNGYVLLEANNGVVAVDKGAGTMELDIDTDVSAEPVVTKENLDWCDVSISGKKILLSYQVNTPNTPREGKVLIQIGYHSINFRVHQRFDGTNHIEITNPQQDKLKWTATCSSEQVSDGGGVNMIFQEVQTTYWHSAWSPMASLPHWVIVDLKEEMEVNKVRLGWRQNGVKFYANTKTTEIQTSNDGKTFTTVGTIKRTLPAGSPMSGADYEPYTENTFATVKTRYVRLYITESNAGNGTCNIGYFKIYRP